jgi:hypothetical protein
MVDNNIIPLPSTLMKNSFRYDLVYEGKRSFLYRQTVTEKTPAYEVFLKIIRPEKIIKGKVLPPKVKFPSDEDFGKTAWSYTNYDAAVDRFKELER